MYECTGDPRVGGPVTVAALGSPLPSQSTCAPRGCFIAERSLVPQPPHSSRDLNTLHTPQAVCCPPKVGSPVVRPSPEWLF